MKITKTIIIILLFLFVILACDYSINDLQLSPKERERVVEIEKKEKDGWRFFRKFWFK